MQPLIQSNPVGHNPTGKCSAILYGAHMIYLPRELTDKQLESILLAGEHAFDEPVRQLACSEPPVIYADANTDSGKRALVTLMDCARELIKRQTIKAMARCGEAQSGKQVRDYFVEHFSGYEYEAFAVVFLDAQCRFLTVEELFRGTLRETTVYPREIARRALAVNAGGVILSHNHPSGSAEVSRADRHLTSAIKQAMSFIDVLVLDHIVVAGNTSVSMVETGLM
jgi:DNA repair protein RadC